jgi:hypothetical protein
MLYAGSITLVARLCIYDPQCNRKCNKEGHERKSHPQTELGRPNGFGNAGRTVSALSKRANVVLKIVNVAVRNFHDTVR